MNPQFAQANIPDKLFYKIGEVCDIVGVQAHVLRYWETEFPTLQPQKNRAGQRTYRRKDVEMALRIRDLLYGEGFTIAGAKRKLQNEGRGASRLTVVPPPSSFTLSLNEPEPPPQMPPAYAPPTPPPAPAPRPLSRDTLKRLRLMLEDMLTTLNRNVLD